MAIETVIEPYELLVRWKNGAITGAHMIHAVRTIQDGVTIATTELPPQSVVDASGDGSLVDEVLGIVQTSALADKASAESVAAAALDEIDRLRARITELEQDNAGMSALIEESGIRQKSKEQRDPVDVSEDEEPSN